MRAADTGEGEGAVVNFALLAARPKSPRRSCASASAKRAIKRESRESGLIRGINGVDGGLATDNNANNRGRSSPIAPQL